MTTTTAPRERKDPLLPLLAAAVSVVLIGALLHFYPRVKRWLGPDVASVAGHVQAPDEAVPVWVCRGVEGVGLLLRATRDDEGLADAFEGGPYRFLTLHVWNFARDEPFDLTLPAKGLLSPEGGEPALPAAVLVKQDVPERLRPVLLGVGAVTSVRVPKGHGGKALLVLRDDPAARTGFVLGELSFERRQLERRTLAQFEQRPDSKQFEDF
jgi:hypothetical protein